MLHSIKYGETSVIARVFTREFGLQSYLVPGVRKAKARIRQNLFQPLCILDMIVYHKEKEGLHRIKEITSPHPYESIPYDIPKTTIALFLAEMLHHSIKSHEANPALFDFIRDALLALDRTKERTADFHLVFLMRLTGYLGFFPRNNYDNLQCYFHLQDGLFKDRPGSPELSLDKSLSRWFHMLIASGMQAHTAFAAPKELRKALLVTMIDYYKLHLEGFQEVKSHAVLEMVLAVD